MDRVIELDGKEIGLRATALTPRIYRHRIGRDLIADMALLKKIAARKKAEGDKKPVVSSDEILNDPLVTPDEILEDIAWVMAKQYGGESVPETVEEWLDEMCMSDTRKIMPEIISLWNENNRTTSKAKKK